MFLYFETRYGSIISAFYDKFCRERHIFVEKDDKTCKGQGDPINYKAHIPAGITFAALFSLVMGWVAVVPVLVGGAIGGALPDIDTEGASVEKLGSKTAQIANKTIGKVGVPGLALSRVAKAIGHAVDLIFLKPLGKLWRFLSKNVFGRIYLMIYRLGSFGSDKKSLGELLHWSGDTKPWAHRGGITHSFSFMLTSCIFLVPLSFVFQSPELLLGAELGILSHLFADSLCKSGVKFFFPFQPKIGFNNDTGSGRGRDVRLMPKMFQVSTGKDQITKAELEAMDDIKAAKERKLKHREIMWQYIFKATAVISVLFLLVGFGVRSGGIAFSAPIFGGEPLAEVTIPLGGDGEQEGTAISNNALSDTGEASSADSASANADAGKKTGSETSAASAETNNDNGKVTGDTGASDSTDGATSQFDVATAGGSTEGANIIHLDGEGQTKPEIIGPRRLTKSDLSIRELPRGVIKMPDESLWIVGIGPVTRENLDNTNGKWVFSEAEKEALLRAAAAGRENGIPESISQSIAGGIQDVNDAVDKGMNAVKDAAGNAANSIKDATKDDDDSGRGGFLDAIIGFQGLTPFTQSG